MPETNHFASDTISSYLRRTLRVIREPRFAVAFGTGFLRFFLDYGLYTYLPLLLVLRYGASRHGGGLVDRGVRRRLHSHGHERSAASIRRLSGRALSHRGVPRRARSGLTIIALDPSRSVAHRGRAPSCSGSATD